MRKFRDILLESKGQIVFTLEDSIHPQLDTKNFSDKVALLVVLIHIASIHLKHKIQKKKRSVDILSQSCVYEKDVS